MAADNLDPDVLAASAIEAMDEDTDAPQIQDAHVLATLALAGYVRHLVIAVDEATRALWAINETVGRDRA